MLQISRILHAGYVFRCDGVEIAFDPIFENPFSRNCHAFPSVQFDPEQIRDQRFAAVFISHYHDDHCSFDSLDLLPRDTPIYMYCLFEEMFDMLRELGFTHVEQLRTDVPVKVGPFTVTPREALDAEVDSMFQVEASGLNVLNVVDAWIAPETVTKLAAIACWDMVLWPFQTMREVAVLSPLRADKSAPELPSEFIEQLAELQPRYIVPSSCQFVQEPWSWYNHAMFPITYRQFALQIAAALPTAQVVRLDPSVSFVLSANALTPAAPLPWVVPVGPQDIDFDYRPGAMPPHTSEIAQRFPATDMARVHAWCSVGLLEKYRAMTLPEGSYFETAQLWQLSVYDHLGQATHYRYQICGDTIAAVNEGTPSWLTEVPAARLYGALEQGESLTSMYMRINDVRFIPDVEAALLDAEVVDDPLVRCLFNDVFGAYQREQLHKLLSRKPG